MSEGRLAENGTVSISRSEPGVRFAPIVASGTSLRQAQMNYLRQTLLGPVRAIERFCELLGQDLIQADRPAPFLERFSKMQLAARKLHELAAQKLSGTFDGQSDEDFRTALATIRFELRNQLGKVVGYCQMLEREEAKTYFGAFESQLETIQNYSAECRRKLIDDADLPTSLPELVPVLGAAIERETPGSILLLDRDDADADLLAELLQRKDHRVQRVQDAREALELIQRGGVELVLSELMLSGMNGFEFLAEMGRRGLTRLVPVVILSAWDESERAAQCIELGAEDYIRKPIIECLLYARVNSCLAKARMRRRELEQFFPTDIARQLIENPEELNVGKEAQVTVLFSDIRNFSSISAKLGAKKTVEWVRDVMGLLSECVIRNGGTLVNYVGDELLAVWGAPVPVQDHANPACRAAQEMLAQTAELTERWESVIGEPVRFGVGINTGLAHVGNTGTARKFQYGPLGNTVNVGSRIQGATKHLTRPFLITEATYDATGQAFPARRIGQIWLVNIPAPVTIYEPAPDQRVSGWLDLKWVYEDALSAFEQMHFGECVQMLGGILTRFPDDGPTRILLARAANCLAAPPPPTEFDPAWDFKQK